MANDLGQQTEFAFMQEGGVLADDGMDKDPVSGNDVPSGSMAKEFLKEFNQAMTLLKI